VTLRDFHDEIADHDLEHNFGDISISNIGAGVSAEGIPPARRTHQKATVVIPMFPEDVGASDSLAGPRQRADVSRRHRA
jgi:hypothetical protein